MAMRIVPFSADIALGLFESLKPFPVDLDYAWRWIGYAKKQNALDVLVDVFEEGVDFLRSNVKSPTGGRPRDVIMLTVDCFKQLGMMAKTDNGKQIRRYFLDCEAKAKAVGNRRLSDQEITKLCVLGSPTTYVVRFEDAFYDELSRLTGLHQEGHKRPRWWGQLTKEWSMTCSQKG